LGLKESKKDQAMFTYANHASQTVTAIAGAFITALLFVSAATSLPIA
jgi:hypothetical protein